MYTRFFGNYLLNNHYITTEQMLNALEVQHNAHIKIGVLAIHAGYMTSSQVERVHILQTHEDLHFGELAIREGFLTQQQLDELLESQKPDYLLFSQALVDKGYMTATEFEKAMTDYQKDYQLTDKDFANLRNDSTMKLIRSFYDLSNDRSSQLYAQYISLLFNNIIRFIGIDFSPQQPVRVSSFPPEGHLVSQNITGEINTSSYYISDEPAVIAFASRYAGEEFTEMDEYVEASIEDFLNLHNGLYITNLSNMYSIELSLEPPATNVPPVIDENKKYDLLPVTFTFGTVNFILATARR